MAGRSPLLALAFLTVAAVPSRGQIEVAKLNATPHGGSDDFGDVVSVSGDVVVVGAQRGLNDAGESTGAAYVFRRNGNGWMQEAKLTEASSIVDSAFGCSVSVDGDTIVVGAYYTENSVGVRTEAAYVFGYDGVEWVEKDKLTAHDGMVNDWYGHWVAVEGDIIVVGSFFHDHVSNNAGSCYIYRYNVNSESWQQQRELLPPGPADDDWFGQAVAISGDTVLIGAKRDNDVVSRSGSAYVYRVDNKGTPADPFDDIWQLETKLTAPVPGLHDEFGFSVAIDGDMALVGEHRRDIGFEMSAGAAYLFRREGTTWMHQQMLLPDVSHCTDYFGDAVAIDGGIAVVGAREYVTAGGRTGAAFVYHDCGQQWERVSMIIGSDTTNARQFGLSMSVSGRSIVVGEHHANHNAGAVYVFEGLSLVPVVTGYGALFMGMMLLLCGRSVILGRRGYSENIKKY
jgi:hypothetical protein